MDKVLCVNGSTKVQVVSSSSRTLSFSDQEMDKRARFAVYSAIKKAEIRQKPIAKYDRETGRAYIQSPSGERKYV